MKDAFGLLAIAILTLSIAYFGATYLGGIGFGNGDGCCGLYDPR